MCLCCHLRGRNTLLILKGIDDIYLKGVWWMEFDDRNVASSVNFVTNYSYECKMCVLTKNLIVYSLIIFKFLYLQSTMGPPKCSNYKVPYLMKQLCMVCDMWFFSFFPNENWDNNFQHLNVIHAWTGLVYMT